MRHEYRLTEKGASLYINVLQMHEWAKRWLIGKNDQTLILTHSPCGAPLHSELVCSECYKPLKATEVTFDQNFRQAPNVNS